jgi:hypothetical protein
MQERAMRKRLLAAVLELFSLTVHASHLVRLDVDQQASSYAVYVVMELDAPAEKVRAILTDYAHLDRLNASITASEITDVKEDGTVRVLTRFENCILFFCITVQRVEDITEEVRRISRRNLWRAMQPRRVSPPSNPGRRWVRLLPRLSWPCPSLANQLLPRVPTRWRNAGTWKQLWVPFQTWRLRRSPPSTGV